jgi:hypothetical protein
MADDFGAAPSLSVVVGPADGGAVFKEPAPPLSTVMPHGSSRDGLTHEQIAGDLAAHLGHVILADPGLHQVGDEKLKPVRRTRDAQFEVVNMTLEQMKKAASKGAKLELCAMGTLMGPEAHLEWMRHWRRVKIEETVAAVKDVGAQNFILATDLGQYGN